MKHCYALVFLFFTTVVLNAQSNYKPGLVVTSAGDTLRGFIDYREWDKNPTSISFKETEAVRNSKEFTPANCAYFAITGFRTYERFTGRISQDKVDMRNIPSSLDTSTTKATVFLKLLQKGNNISLYAYQDELKNRYFLKQEQEAKPQELIYRRYLSSNDKLKVVMVTDYRVQLWYAASAQNQTLPELKRRIENADYTESDLLPIVSRINNKSKQELTSNKSTSSQFRYFAGLGINRTLLKSELPIQTAISHPNQVSWGPKISVGLDAFLNPDVQRLVLRAQLAYYMADFNFSAENTSAEYRLKQTNISASPQLIFNIYNTENLKFNIGGGVYLNYTSYPENVYTRQYKDANGNVVSTSEKKGLYYYKTLGYGFLLRTGVTLNKKIDVAVLVYPTTTVSIFKMNTLQIEANYLFNLNNR